jgi:hypothetical protein
MYTRVYIYSIKLIVGALRFGVAIKQEIDAGTSVEEDVS